MPHQLAEFGFFRLDQAHVILQLLRWDIDVPRVPEHPPDQAEEDDDGARVNEQVVDSEPCEHPHHHDENAEYVVADCKPEGELAAAHSWVYLLRDWLYLYRS